MTSIVKPILTKMTAEVNVKQELIEVFVDVLKYFLRFRKFLNLEGSSKLTKTAADDLRIKQTINH